MANNYTIDFTDEIRSFQLNPYTTNGPRHPTSNTLSNTAASAASSLRFFGKGSPDYGEGLQEDMLHTLENFAGIKEPTYPISGQIWFDRGNSPHVLRVFNSIKHDIITNDPLGPNVGNVNFVTIAGDLTARFGDITGTFPGPVTRLIVTNSAYDQQEYLIATSTLDGNGDTLINISPSQTAPNELVLGGWTVGGWEYIIQNNVGLVEDLDANSNTITNLSTPINLTDAANKSYVDTQISVNGNLDALSDVLLTLPIADESLLVYDLGQGQWVNKVGTSAGYLPLVGGVMLGSIDMQANNLFVKPLNGLSGSTEAADKAYVDSAVTGLVVPTVLDDLADVFATTPTPNDILQFDGAVWNSVDLSTFQASLGAVLITGSVMTGDLILNGDPLVPLQAATMSYVDTELANAISASGDGVVNGGFFNNLLQELTLTRTNGLPNIVVTGFASGGTSSTQTFHLIAQPTTQQGMLDLYWEQIFYSNPAYPTATLSEMLTNISQTLGDMSQPNQRVMFAAHGGTDYDIGDDVTGTFGDVGMDFVPGYNNLTISVNGVKQYADEHGWLEVDATQGAINPATDTDQLWPGMPTGLIAGTTYAFQIQLNAGTPSDSGLITILVDGTSANNMGNLVEQILVASDASTNNFSGQSSDAIAPFGLRLSDAHLTFYSSFPGVDSSVTLTDGDGGANTPLFASIVGGTDNGGRTYTYTIPSASINSGLANVGAGINPPAPLTWGYREVGRVGRVSTKFIFTSGSEPVAASAIEIITAPAHFVDGNPQP